MVAGTVLGALERSPRVRAGSNRLACREGRLPNDPPRAWGFTIRPEAGSGVRRIPHWCGEFAVTPD